MNIDDQITTAFRRPVPQAVDAAARLSARVVREGRAELYYATIGSPVGELLVVASRRGLTRLHFCDGALDLDRTLEDLAQRRSPRIIESAAATDPWRRELDEYFAGARRQFEEPLDWQEITGFRRRVLRAAAAVPYGESRSYRTIAAAAGSPSGARAAGNALGANPIAIVIPCHRVLHAGGGLGGYTGGLERKEILLALEGIKS